MPHALGPPRRLGAASCSVPLERPPRSAPTPAACAADPFPDRAAPDVHAHRGRRRRDADPWVGRDRVGVQGRWGCAEGDTVGGGMTARLGRRRCSECTPGAWHPCLSFMQTWSGLVRPKYSLRVPTRLAQALNIAYSSAVLLHFFACLWCALVLAFRARWCRLLAALGWPPPPLEALLVHTGGGASRQRRLASQPTTVVALVPACVDKLAPLSFLNLAPPSSV